MSIWDVAFFCQLKTRGILGVPYSVKFDCGIHRYTIRDSPRTPRTVADVQTGAIETLAEAVKKKACRTLLTSEECTFGASCRYSHYQPDELVLLKEQARWIEYHKTKRTVEVMGKLNCVVNTTKKFLSKQSEKQLKESTEYKQFWNYPEALKERNLPPSLQEINPIRIDSISFTGWG